ncbi:MAG: hypothetical protein JKX94_04795 [Sneathiella sp.]|nr:hypothetical protein [Sneathiella sp.]
MRKILFSLLALLIIPALTPSVSADEYSAALEELAGNQIKGWAQSSEVVSAIMAQNKKSASLDQAAIDSLDKKWRAETKGGDKSMINAVLSNSLSAYLKNIKEQSEGLYTEIFVMDNKGLNVGQSDVTSDYWQGDEGKWQKSFGAGPSGQLIDDVEFDDSSQTYQSQVSIAIVDPASNEPIGAVTVGVNVEALE